MRALMIIGLWALGMLGFIGLLVWRSHCKEKAVKELERMYARQQRSLGSFVKRYWVTSCICTTNKVEKQEVALDFLASITRIQPRIRGIQGMQDLVIIY